MGALLVPLVMFVIGSRANNGGPGSEGQGRARFPEGYCKTMVSPFRGRAKTGWLERSLLVLGALLLTLSQAHANFLKSAQAQSFVDQMVSQHGFDRHQVEHWLAQATPQTAILEAMQRPAEKTLAWKNYRRIFLKPQRIELGRAFMAKYHDALERARQRFGVPPAMVAAIIGVETLYGRNTGQYRVIDALSTLAFDYPPQSGFFRKELGQYLMLAREQNFNPMQLRGSYAGAMGYGQFMPSSYREYAIDFDGDKVADIIHDPVDAIGSVANYFAQHGWQPGQPIAQRVDVSPAVAGRFVTAGLDMVHTVSQLRQGNVPLKVTLAGSQPANLLKLEGAKGAEYFATFRNFYVITRYNHSALYAMAVRDLALALEKPQSGDAEVAGR